MESAVKSGGMVFINFPVPKSHTFKSTNINKHTHQKNKQESERDSITK